MGDICEVGTRTQFVIIDPPHSIYYLILCADSDIIHVNALGTSMIILNSYKVATDLLEERSSTYSSRWVRVPKFPQMNSRNPLLASIRPHLIMLHEL
jgi:hypothetical protein